MGRHQSKKRHIEEKFQDTLNLENDYYDRFSKWLELLEKLIKNAPLSLIPSIANSLASEGYGPDENGIPRKMGTPTEWKDRTHDTLVFIADLPGNLEYKAKLLEGAIKLMHSAISYHKFLIKYRGIVTVEQCWSVFLQSNLLDYIMAMGYKEKHIRSEDFKITKEEIGQKLWRLEEKLAKDKLQE